ncbi:ComEA family DNA-binding protein [Paenibacillus sp. y28]|uniref:ComEA family DNA-binding protein n=1 Tax=Paenibacillus sp. y28 TaxID=3129110 RepID=UPI00301B530E
MQFSTKWMIAAAVVLAGGLGAIGWATSTDTIAPAGWRVVNTQVAGLLQEAQADKQGGSGVKIAHGPQASAQPSTSPSPGKPQEPKKPAASSPIVRLNAATLEQLMTLPGIGESKGKAILAYREAHGPFRKPEDLLKVKGIGAKTLDKFRDRLDVSVSGTP